MHVLKPLLNLFLQGRCPLCQRSTEQTICLDCQRQLQRCRHSQAQQHWQGDLPVLAWGVYGGTLKRAIAVLKYENQPQLAQPLGHWLGQTWNEHRTIRDRLTVVPVPMHADKQKLRGYNQADLLAKAFCQVTELKLRRGLERSRATKAQFGLSIAARNQNLSGAFQLSQDFLRHPPRGAVLLLDDIYTTGATIRAAAAMLQQHQIAVCGAVAIAKPILAKEATDDSIES